MSKFVTRYFLTERESLIMIPKLDTTRIKNSVDRRLFETNQSYEIRVDMALKVAVIHAVYYKDAVVMNKRVHESIINSIDTLFNQLPASRKDLTNVGNLLNLIKNNGYKYNPLIDSFYSYILGGYKFSRYLKNNSLRIRPR